MKFLTMMILMLSFNTFANDDEHMGEGFDNAKAAVLKHIDKRSSNLTTYKSCVEAAKDKKALKSCHKENKGRMKEMKKEGKKKMKNMKKMKAKKNKKDKESEE